MTSAFLFLAFTFVVASSMELQADSIEHGQSSIEFDSQQADVIEHEQPQDFSSCVSEGGDVNCADCSLTGGMCQQVYESLSVYDSEFHTGGNANLLCPTIFPNPLVDMKVFVMWRSKTGEGNPRRYCKPLSVLSNMEFGFEARNFFMLDAWEGSPYMITKILFGHPNRADARVGGVGIKAVLMHRHSVTGAWVGDVHKLAFCVRCPTAVFESVYTRRSLGSDGMTPFEQCVGQAFSLNGTRTVLNDGFACTDQDQDYFRPMGITF